MKILEISVENYRNCVDYFKIDFTTKSRVMSEDKEYELIELADGLFTFNTVAFIGKHREKPRFVS